MKLPAPGSLAEAVKGTNLGDTLQVSSTYAQQYASTTQVTMSIPLETNQQNIPTPVLLDALASFPKPTQDPIITPLASPIPTPELLAETAKITRYFSTGSVELPATDAQQLTAPEHITAAPVPRLGKTLQHPKSSTALPHTGKPLAYTTPHSLRSSPLQIPPIKSQPPFARS